MQETIYGITDKATPTTWKKKKSKEKKGDEATRGRVEGEGIKKIKKIEKSVDKGEVVWYNSKAHLRNGSLETAHEWVMHLEN